MAYNTKNMLVDASGTPIPQYYDPVNDVFKPLTDPSNVKLYGSKVVEQKTESDAVANTVTFSTYINTIEIYNTDEINDGVFNINGMNIMVPAGKGFKATFGGTPRTNITVSGSTSYILTRYE